MHIRQFAGKQRFHEALMAPESGGRRLTRLPAALWATVLMMTLAAPVTAAPAADLWPYWDQSDRASSRSVDHGAWQALLDSHLRTLDDGRTVFRYDAVSSADRQGLDGYVSSLTALDPRNLARAEQLAYWINLYNALTVRVVLDHPEENSIRDMGGGWFASGPWNAALVEITGKPVTLNDIEHRILRPIWKDRRIHYAVNCASVSCPNLAPHAYTAENAPRLMDEGEKHYLHHPRGLRFDDAGLLHLSSIYDWYLADFGGSRTSLLDYLAGERPDLADRLTNYQGRIHYHYDWSLNDAD